MCIGRQSYVCKIYFNTGSSLVQNRRKSYFLHLLVNDSILNHAMYNMLHSWVAGTPTVTSNVAVRINLRLDYLLWVEIPPLGEFTSSGTFPIPLIQG